MALRVTTQVRFAKALPLVAAGTVASVASFASTVLVAHLIGASAYGAFVQLLALFLVLSMPGTALMVGVVRRVAAWEVRGEGHRVRAWVARVHRVGVAAAVAFAVALWVARAPIVHLLALPSSTGLVEILSAGWLWVLVSVDRGLLQARRVYGDLSANLVVEGVVRTVAMIGLCAAGLGLEGAALGLFLAELCAVLHARWRVTRSLLTPVAFHGEEVVAGVDRVAVEHSGRDLAMDVVTALVSLGLLAVLQNADTILVGSLSPGSKDAYAAISVPSKALIFWALTFGNYLLPEATIRHHQGRRALRQLGHTGAVLAPIAMALLVVAIVFPHPALELVFGPSGAQGAPAFASLGLAMVFLCITVVLTSYLLGVGRRWITLLLGAAAVALVVTSVVSHGRVVDTARCDLVVQGLLAVAVVAGFVIFDTRHRADR